MGKSDPYAVLKFGKQKDKTNTIKNTLEPQWDHHAEFKLPDGNANKLLVEVFDADKLGKDKSLGKVELDVLDLAADEGRWFPLQGKICFSLKVLSNESGKYVVSIKPFLKTFRSAVFLFSFNGTPPQEQHKIFTVFMQHFN